MIYYFDYYDADVPVLDEEGRSCDSFQDAQKTATRELRFLVSADALSGRINTACYILLRTNSGDAARIAFKDAIAIF